VKVINGAVSVQVWPLQLLGLISYVIPDEGSLVLRLGLSLYHAGQ